MALKISVFSVLRAVIEQYLSPRSGVKSGKVN